MIGMFSALSLTVRIGMIIAAVVSFATIGGVIYHGIWKRGYDHALRDIARQDDRAIGKATEYRSRFIDCRARGLRWNTETGECGGR